MQGVGVGNGLTDPVIQYQYYPEMAMNNSYGIKTVSEETYAEMVDKVPRCKKLAQGNNILIILIGWYYCSLSGK